MSKQTFVVPSHAAKSGVFLCTPLDAEVVERSAVLRDLSNIGGPTSLPNGLSENDIAAWMSMDPTTVPLWEMSLRDLCKAIQVACKLGDGHTSRIARAVAAKLEHVEKTEEIEDLIISLDSNALHAVFLSCITTNLNPDILPVIKDWPARMQQACFRWHAATTKSITTCDHEDAAVRLRLLAGCQPPPGLKTLFVTRTPHQPEPMANLGAVLEANRATLQSLLLHEIHFTLQTSVPSIAIWNALQDLSCLTSLSLSLVRLFPQGLGPTVTTLFAITSAVIALPQLESFSLEQVCTPECLQGSLPNPEPVQPRDADASEPPPKRAKRCQAKAVAAASACDAYLRLEPPSPAHTTLDPLIAALASAHHLTSLTLTHTCPAVPCSGIQGGFQKLLLLNLNGMHLTPDASRARTVRDASRDLAPFSITSPVHPLARLPCLRIFSMLDGSARTAETARALLRQLSVQPRLEEVHLDVSNVLGGTEPLLPDIDALLQARRRSLTCLTLALGVQWQPQIEGTVNRTVAAIARLPALRAVSLSFANVSARPLRPRSMPAAFTAPALSLAPLQRLRRLEGLALAFSPTLPRVARSSFVSQLHLFPFHKLTGLTRLGLSCKEFWEWSVMLLGQSLASHISPLTNLRCLRLSDLTCSYSVTLKSLLAPLIRLTRLELHVHPLPSSVLSSIATAMRGMPQLREAVFVPPAGMQPLPSFVHSLPQLPCRGRYEFRGMLPKPLEPAVTMPIRRALDDQGARVQPQFACIEYGLPELPERPWPFDSVPGESEEEMEEEDGWSESEEEVDDEDEVAEEEGSEGEGSGEEGSGEEAGEDEESEDEAGGGVVEDVEGEEAEQTECEGEGDEGREVDGEDDDAIEESEEDEKGGEGDADEVERQAGEGEGDDDDATEGSEEDEDGTEGDGDEVEAGVGGGTDEAGSETAAGGVHEGSQGGLDETEEEEGGEEDCSGDEDDDSDEYEEEEEEPEVGIFADMELGPDDGCDEHLGVIM